MSDTQGLNLFIIDDNQLMAAGLKNYLVNKFGNALAISVFITGESAVEKMDKNTRIVILDYFLGAERGNDILKLIKKINPRTEVIMFSSNEDVGVAVEAIRNGATDYLVKGEGSWKKLVALIHRIIWFPVKIVVKEFEISEYLAILLLTLLVIAGGVFFALRFHYF